MKLKIVLKIHFAFVKVGRAHMGHVQFVLASYAILYPDLYEFHQD